jgi:hypothetical protein
LNAAGTALDYCGYIGGSAEDKGNGIAVDSAGNAYVVGNTFSNESSFPVTGGPDLTLNNRQDAFVAKIVGVLVNNGAFEAGTLDGWTATTTCGGGGWFAYSGATTPISGLSFYTPPEGTSAAVSDATASPGTHILHQDVVLASGQSHSLAFTLSYTNRAASFSSPATLDCTVNPNQQYRVDIMKVTSAIDSMTPSDILLNVFKTNPDDPLTLQTNITVDLSSLAGQSVRMRFAEVDNQGLLNASVDNVRITSSPLVQCTYSINPPVRNFSAAGGSGSVDVTATSGCAWGAISNEFWIVITGPTGGNENGAISFLVQHNNGFARNGTITVAGQSFTVRQGANFADVDTNNFFYEFIGKLSAVGITVGCGQDQQGQPLYCPSQQVTREQMSAFIIRALGEFNPPFPAQQRFTDVLPANFFYPFVDQLAVRGITTGCNPQGPLYCPIQSVTREQMAAFLIRAVGMPNPPFPAQQRFLDVGPANFFYPFVEQLALRGITTGCNPPAGNLYCPGDFVTREQMAAFLVRAFGL